MSDRKTLRLSSVAAIALAPFVLAGVANAQGYVPSTAKGDWPMYFADLSGSRYLPADQINASNFNKLELAWHFKTDAMGAHPEFKLEAPQVQDQRHGVEAGAEIALQAARVQGALQVQAVETPFRRARAVGVDDADLGQLHHPVDLGAAGAGQVVGTERLRFAHHGGAADDDFLHDQTPRWRRGLNGRSCCILR